jgi:hypothetical protein
MEWKLLILLGEVCYYADEMKKKKVIYRQIIIAILLEVIAEVSRGHST